MKTTGCRLFKTFLQIFLAGNAVLPVSFAADNSVSQTGNIVQIKSKELGNLILIGDPGFSELRNYEFVIELPSRETPKEEPAPAQGDAKEDTSEKPEKAEAEAEVKPQGDITLILARVNELYNDGKYLVALMAVEDAIKIKPDSAKAKAMRGSLKEVLGDHEGALKDWLEASKLETDDKLKRQLETQMPRAQ